MTTIFTKKDYPTLNLTTIPDISTHRQAILSFLEEHKSEKTVAVIGIDNVMRWLSTNPEYSKLTIQELTTPKLYATDDDKITVTNPADVVKTFLELTAFTVPYMYEHQMYDDTLTHLGFERNGRGNYLKTVGNGSSNTLFVAHLDTADRYKPVKVNHVFKDDFVMTDGSSYLGADDRAGLAVLLYLASQNVPGDYLLVIGEECGCVGSSMEAAHIPQGKYDRAIQFDRAGTSEIITHQMNRRTASREFARALAKQFTKASDGVLRLQPSDQGVYTDTKEFTNVIKECTNISVGYVSQHSVREMQDLSYLVTLAHAAAKVDWESLPTRQPYSDPNMLSYGTSVYNFADGYDDEDVPFYDTESTDVGKKNMWEVWAEVDAGNYSADELRTWVIFNPLIAAKILERFYAQDPNGSLDILTEVDMGG